MTWGDVLVSVAQVAAGGTIVQAVVALTRRRSELRQLDRGTDSVAVETADRMITMLRAELESTKAENAQLKAELADQQRQIHLLGERVSDLRADLVVARAEIDRLQDRKE
jgi:predicted RNase H-like nuclease (RuvC/YqgF family)